MIDIMTVGFPRSGNTWLGRLLSDLLDSPYDGDTKFCQTGEGGYHIRKTHMRAEDWDGESKVVFIQRDPRDVACSLMHYRSLPMDGESLMKVIMTMTRGPREQAMVLGEMGQYNNFVRGWMILAEHLCGTVTPIRYEWLQDYRNHPVHEVFSLLTDLNFDYMRMPQVFENQSFEQWQPQYEHSMWRGQVGTWKKFFKRKHGKIITKRIGPLMLDMGYIDDLDWWRKLK